MLTGIFTGLGAAFSQSLSYLGARHFNHHRKNASRQLLVLGQLWMGLFAAAVLVWQWPGGWAWLGRVWVPVVLAVCAYLVGQAGMMLALQTCRAQPGVAAAGREDFIPCDAFVGLAAAPVRPGGGGWGRADINVSGQACCWRWGRPWR